MGLRDLLGRAKTTVDDRGGVDSLKEDAEELKGIARGEGSAADKAKKAAAAVRDPGATGGKPAESSSAEHPPATPRV